MVKVITIMDDVYADLYRLKRAKGLSFTGAIRYLLKEAGDEKKQILAFAGSIDAGEVDRRAEGYARRERVLVR
ncbi:hypothetical protein H0O02_01075 [Candidatus Micrarchaeota archaeon]|nr:hypothetical protein [Candidatus Micrarchaeota archaeon]